MKILLLATVLVFSVSCACKKKPHGHDVEHMHVEDAKQAHHEHDDTHHHAHDHKAHHPEHDEAVKKKKK